MNAPLYATPPHRAEGLRRLRSFVPKAGRAYAAKRNFDLPGHPHVSRLSPYLRHRMVTEEEVLRAVLGRHSLASAQKFVQEVYWRTYWKGWLERRPAVWSQYRAEVLRGLDRLATEGGLRRDWEAACRGQTGLVCFDCWAEELVTTGYLHNHARMWFASIWIFTLNLPWALGADFFLRHLLDGDPASNTLGWRWVAGLQTRGKTYLARSDNIRRYTDGRFDPAGQLAREAPALDGPAPPPPMAPPAPDAWDRTAPTAWLLTEEDLAAGHLGLTQAGGPVAAMVSPEARSPLQIAPHVGQFTRSAAVNALEQLSAGAPVAGPFDGPDRLEAVADWAADTGARQLVTPYAPVGPAAEALDALRPKLRERGITLHLALRGHDAMAWPHAGAGFFKFKEKIPRLVAELKGLRAA